MPIEKSIDISSAITSSLILLFQAYIPAAILAMGVGILIGHFNLIYQIFKRIFQIPASLPAIALLPLALAGSQMRQYATLSVVFYSAIWPIIINTATGVQTFRLEGNKRIAISQIFTGLRFSLGLAWVTAIASEMLTGDRGIGFFIWDAYNSNNLNAIFEAIFYIVFVNFLLDMMLDAAEYAIARHFSKEGKKDE